MADKKISELSTLVTAATGDWLAVVDVSAGSKFAVAFFWAKAQ